MRIRYERGALADLIEIFAYVAAQNRDAAARLVSNIEAAVARIASNPYIGVATRNPYFRRFRVARYLIVYEISTTEIIIQYVRHDARRHPWEEDR
ncbi:MAG TPA: type II toxin-antitoxin system RelE/ParE family toxin [Pseudolabrys sp.]|nr:type II toxin-antitoxin system RelE/ParE family toxin [Pseudolabrys sp.]